MKRDKTMKTVFTNSECIHVYAQRTQEQGRTNNGNVWFNGDVIYSYGHHFPMACFIDNNAILVNDDSYSISTSQHQSELRMAVSHYNTFYVPTQILKDFLYTKKFDKSFKEKLVKYAMNKSNQYINCATKRRKISLKESDLSSARYELRKAIELFTHFKKKPPVKLTKALNTLNNDIDTVLNEHKVALDKAKKASDRKEKAKQKQLMKNAEKWRSNTLEPGQSIYGLSKTLMRVNGDNIETSKNANFPIEHAKKAFKLIRAVKEKGETWTNDNHEIRLGYYKIDKIDNKGNVTAGCHYVEWDQIELCAIELNIYP